MPEPTDIGQFLSSIAEKPTMGDSPAGGSAFAELTHPGDASGMRLEWLMARGQPGDRGLFRDEVEDLVKLAGFKPEAFHQSSMKADGVTYPIWFLHPIGGKK